ncbi:MBL fold metallo-hydrolase [Virgibacillus ndiopensis]|uniref:MBL fold metallo-hydrolase n=1 Tax=Virgibacillus ndiopensis TaxID=2004408 RepID=UPI000C07B2BF|nr:MBL fold metallo-hydrolase [Virgibacillus ndiopensis]
MLNFTQEQNQLQVQEGQLGIAWTGQAGFALMDSDNIIYHIDPYLSNACSKTIGYHRIIPAPSEAKNTKADFILFTHEHKDHLDPDSVPLISQFNPSSKLVGPSSCIKILRDMNISSTRLIKLDRGEGIQLGNLQLQAVMAIHTNDSIGYVIDLNGIKFYITGDTTYSDDLIGVTDWELDMMMVCINGRLGCMNIPDAARLTAHIQPKYAIPMHFGMFKENTANPKEFIRQVEAYSGIVKGYIMKHGHWYLFDKNDGFIARNDNL